MSQTFNNSDDHDILIELKTSFNLFQKQYQSDMKELKEGNTKILGDHEVRIRTIEKVFEYVNPEESYRDFRKLEQKVHDTETKAKMLRWVWNAISAVFAAVFGLFSAQILRLMGLPH